MAHYEYPGGITFIAVIALGTFVGSRLVLALFQARFPSWASGAKSVLAIIKDGSSWASRAKDVLAIIRGGKSSHLIDNDELRSKTRTLTSQLNDLGGRGRLHGRHPSTEQAKKIVDNLEKLAKYTKDVLGGSKAPALVRIAALHMPVISVAVVALEPVLIKFAEAKETDDLVVRTSDRITGLLEETKTVVRRVSGDRTVLTEDEVSDIHSLLLIIEEGLRLVRKIMGEREKSSYVARLWRTGTHKKQLESWLDDTKEFVKRIGRQNSSVMGIRIRQIRERQLKYFKFLAYSSLFHSFLLLSLTYGVFFIIIPLLKKDNFLVASFKYVANQGKAIWKSVQGQGK